MNVMNEIRIHPYLHTEKAALAGSAAFHGLRNFYRHRLRLAPIPVLVTVLSRNTQSGENRLPSNGHNPVYGYSILFIGFTMRIERAVEFDIRP